VLLLKFCFSEFLLKKLKQTDRQTDRISISISHMKLLARDKNIEYWFINRVQNNTCCTKEKEHE